MTFRIFVNCEFENIPSEWLMKNLSNPIYPLTFVVEPKIQNMIINSITNQSTSNDDHLIFGYYGQDWAIWSSNFEKITLGEFDNEEDAVLFELTWSK